MKKGAISTLFTNKYSFNDVLKYRIVRVWSLNKKGGWQRKQLSILSNWYIVVPRFYLFSLQSTSVD